MKTGFAAAALLVVCTNTILFAQERFQDRRKYLDPNTPVSDDPRRVPVRPGPRGPDGTLVLRGGRLFDGTGAPVREATVVIERNKIAQILPTGSSDWPHDARVIDVPEKRGLAVRLDLI